MSKLVRGSLTGVVVAAAASYGFSEAIGARTDELTRELSEVRQLYEQHSDKNKEPETHKKAYVSPNEPSFQQEVASKWNAQVLALVNNARKIDYYETGNSWINWAIDSLNGVDTAVTAKPTNDTTITPPAPPKSRIV
ncbi:hypothetical protein E3P99_02765 [Wallemia hederae]|uniref:MICOS complex subunit MIC12 n=1 Tax=Wallemia hederae TaxID=1540922 RepID=A0A4T0FIY2_9BASI|nr:hypothetical protein E3P99_02765 [Wallemia hederae]